MSRLLEVEGLTVDIPVNSGMLHPVRGIDFHVERGETLAIVGESGCGKSLTSLALMGLLPKAARRTARRLEFDGASLPALPERRMADLRGNRMAMVFQEPMTSLNPCYTIGNQLEEALLRHREVSRKQAQERAVGLLEKVGVTGAERRLGQYPHHLSGGLRQRVMIAMALICDPELLICDEPTTALDVTVQAQILHLIASLQRDLGIGVILITHDLGVVARVADRVAVMYAGQIVETGTASEVFGQPLHPYTQGLLACIPVPGRTAPGASLGVIPGIVPPLVGDLTGCSFADRCPYVFDRCTEGAIAAQEVSGGRSYRCLLPADTGAREPTRDFSFDPETAPGAAAGAVAPS